VLETGLRGPFGCLSRRLGGQEELTEQTNNNESPRDLKEIVKGSKGPDAKRPVIIPQKTAVSIQFGGGWDERTSDLLGQPFFAWRGDVNESFLGVKRILN